jgi:glycolate oxidase FAD binding subunit
MPGKSRIPTFRASDMATPAVLTPASAAEVVDAVADARRGRFALEIRGGGSKATIGAPRAATILDMTAFSGVIDYEPGELVLSVWAGTPLAQVQRLVAEHDQMLAFEPFDHGALLGVQPGRATIGGVVAAGVAGSQRLSQGGARDHLLGFEAVSGRGEVFKAGGKVVKNVTGYDLPKLLAGSWGRLAALTQVTLKVLPRPETCTTVVLRGLSLAEAIAAMSKALGSQAEVAAAAYLPGEAVGASQTLLRLQGFAPSVAARAAPLGPTQDGTALWDAVRDVAPLRAASSLWRVVLAPARACELIAALQSLGAKWLLDWAGGLVWIALEDDAGAVRAAASRCGGHASLVRAPEELRRSVPALHPESPGVAALSLRVHRAFDPDGVFAGARFCDPADT